MQACCPPGHGCNSNGSEPCVLALCREMAGVEPQAALALGRWEEWRRVCEQRGAGRREKRFRRRAYERSRDAALVAVLMRRARLARSPARGRRRSTARHGAVLRQQRVPRR